MTLQGQKVTVSKSNQKSGQDYIPELQRRPLKLRIYPDFILRDKAAPVELFDGILEEFAAEMLNFMVRHRGIGLAAPQAGVKRRIIVADIGENPLCMVNPEIVAASGQNSMTEGCLSLPGVNVDIQRTAYLEVRGQNPQGKDIHIKTDGLPARVLQHEIDHLNGVLICDYDNQFMQKDKFKATEIDIGYHPDGFRMDKTASPLNLYTRWEISPEGKWINPTPVCFDSLPAEGWIKVNSFDWNEHGTSKE